MAKRDRSAIDQIEWMRNLLAFMLTGAFVSTIPLFVFKTIPEANEQVVTYMVGQLSGMALMALGFYFVNKVGQDALDAKRTENTKAAFEAITEQAKSAASGAGGEGGALKPGDTVTLDTPPELDVDGVAWDAALHHADKIKDENGRWLPKAE
jgi:hypothetical protein